MKPFNSSDYFKHLCPLFHLAWSTFDPPPLPPDPAWPVMTPPDLWQLAGDSGSGSLAPGGAAVAAVLRTYLFTTDAVARQPNTIWHNRWVYQLLVQHDVRMALAPSADAVRLHEVITDLNRFVGIRTQAELVSVLVLILSPFSLLFPPVVRPSILALEGVQLPLPVLQWSERTERA